MRGMQIFQYLLRHPLKYRRGNICAVMRSNGRIDDYRDHDGRVIDGSESGERCDVFGARIGVSGRIHFLGGACFSRR